MLKTIETLADIREWLAAVRSEYKLKIENVELIVASGTFNDGSTGYGLEVRNEQGDSLAATPISKLLYDMFRSEIDIFEA
ncbi:hypothetical protein [Photobacterium sp. GB-210]|uniref:hypothetical protein n=1 Tax=Photobacterium sp. GB-210 TaxID=2022104 RepID=UPI000D15F0E6|nr:hypothetical protein [Photobacterium sp. GB-210]PSV35170.1 hypothetical protein C9J38_16405 [Photobacterium sp. GB-210]